MIKTTFDWIKHINVLKTPIDEFSDKDWDVFNSYVIHRVLSMNPDYLELVKNLLHLMLAGIRVSKGVASSTFF